MKIYCATGNAGKLKEFQLAAKGTGIDVALLPGLREIPECVEDGATFAENAAIKARYYSSHATGPHAAGLLFADDSGLVVDALDGAPGVHSARFAGPGANDERNNRLLLERLRGVRDRTARFVCVIALVEGADWLPRGARHATRVSSIARPSARVVPLWETDACESWQWWRWC